jgi:hypothetical protein
MNNFSTLFARRPIRPSPQFSGSSFSQPNPAAPNPCQFDFGFYGPIPDYQQIKPCLLTCLPE